MTRLALYADQLNEGLIDLLHSSQAACRFNDGNVSDSALVLLAQASRDGQIIGSKFKKFELDDILKTVNAYNFNSALKEAL